MDIAERLKEYLIQRMNQCYLGSYHGNIEHSICERLISEIDRMSSELKNDSKNQLE